jgi:hypothetical protein
VKDLVTKIGVKAAYEALSMVSEWWIYIDAYPQILVSGREAFSRAFFQFCGSDNMCNRMELLWFLSGYQPWRLGGSTPEVVVAARMNDYIVFASEIQNGTSNLAQSANLIINPTDIDWRSGRIDNEPWQWFNRNSNKPAGLDRCTQVLLPIPAINFEMYTAAQDDVANGRGSLCP